LLLLLLLLLHLFLLRRVLLPLLLIILMLLLAVSSTASTQAAPRVRPHCRPCRNHPLLLLLPLGYSCQHCVQLLHHPEPLAWLHLQQTRPGKLCCCEQSGSDGLQQL
jgi:hypothetical protein